MENIHSTRFATLLLLFVIIFQELKSTTCDSEINLNSGVALKSLMYQEIEHNNSIENSDTNHARQTRQIIYYPYGDYYQRRPLPVIFGGAGFGFGRPGFGGRGFGGRGFGGRGFGGRGFGGRGFGGRGFGGRGFGGRGFGGLGGGGRGGRG